ncbi:MAG: hypothetical protein HGN29_06195 [Asgard group archaeon]|nr:hypothetical protein [Asgard group archaeon]
MKAIPLFYQAREYVQFFYFAWRSYHKLTHGLDESETNMQGFVEAIKGVEKAAEVKKDYFYELAEEALEEEK